MKGQLDLIYAVVLVFVSILVFAIVFKVNATLGEKLYPILQNQSNSSEIEKIQNRTETAFTILDYGLVIGYFALFFLISYLAFAFGGAIVLLVFAIFNFFILAFLSSVFKEVMKDIFLAIGVSNLSASVFLINHFVEINLFLSAIILLVSILLVREGE